MKFHRFCAIGLFVAPLTLATWVANEEAELIASDAAAHAWFGYSVAVSGDTAVVGTPGHGGMGANSGAAYVFVHAGTTWTEQAKLTADDAASGDRFGWSVGVSEDLIVVGAYAATEAGVPSGVAYVFSRSGTAWTQEAKLVASDAEPEDRFGYSLAVSGNTVLVGAYGDDDAGSDSGAAYVFVRSGSTWTEEAKLVAALGADDEYFGRSVALRGDRAVIGADGNCTGEPASGAVFVFDRVDTTWSAWPMLKADVPATYDRFGRAVAVLGDTLVIGAPESNLNESQAGLSYVFVLDGGTWVQRAELSPSDPGAQHRFGAAVAVGDDLAIVGSPGNDAGGVGGGAAYLFCPDGTSWTETQRLTPSDPGPGEYFGHSLAVDWDVLLAGAYRRNTANPDAGSAVLYRMQALAGATSRNGGTNPESYTAVTLPILGATYTGTVDLGGTTGHSLALLTGFAAPLSFTLPGGQVLLVDIIDPAGELLAQGAIAGPLATFHLTIPNDPALAGIDVVTQELHIGAVQPFALSNAQDLRLGH